MGATKGKYGQIRVNKDIFGVNIYINKDKYGEI